MTPSQSHHLRAHSALSTASSTNGSATAHSFAHFAYPDCSYTDTAGDSRDALPANPIAEADSYSLGEETPERAEGSGQNHQGPSLGRLDLDDSCLLVTFRVRPAFPWRAGCRLPLRFRLALLQDGALGGH